jgi:hypothetical protein
LAFEKRPAEELYDVVADPYQLNNLAEDKSFEMIKKDMKDKLQNWMEKTGDLRASEPRSLYWDNVRYTPDYQFKDYDFEQRIKEYKIKPPFGKYAKEGIPCLDQ